MSHQFHLHKKFKGIYTHPKGVKNMEMFVHTVTIYTIISCISKII